MIYLTALLKDGGQEPFSVPDSMLGKLAAGIQEHGAETVHTSSRSVEVVGLLITGKQTGERVIVLGVKEEDE